MCLTFTLWISNAGPFWHILATHKNVSQVKQKCPLLLEMRQTMHLWCKNESGTKNINENVSDVRGEIINSDHSTDIHIISLLSQLKTPATALNRIPPGFFSISIGNKMEREHNHVTNNKHMPSSLLFPKWGSITMGIEGSDDYLQGDKVLRYPPKREFRKSLPPTEHEQGLQLVNMRSQTTSLTQRPQESVVFQLVRAC